MNTIQIAPFEGEYYTKFMGGGGRWRSCQVVGVTTPTTTAGYGAFVIITEDDKGSLTVDVADTVRRTGD